MKTLAAIPAKKKMPFMQNGKKDPFIKASPAKEGIKQVTKEETKADAFAQAVIQNQQVLEAFLQPGSLPASPTTGTKEKEENLPDEGKPLPPALLQALEKETGKSFEEVRIHTDTFSTELTTQLGAAAVTSGKHIFFNTHVYQPSTVDGLHLLAHELFHTLQQGGGQAALEVQLKPLSALNDQTPHQQAALQRAVKIAQGEQGKVNSAALNEDKTRVGWQFLVEYFKTTLGEDTIVASQADYKPGKMLQDVIKYVKRGKAQKVRIVDGEHKVITEDNVDLLPSWCGIFAFWALHKAGIHPPRWELGKASFTAADQFKKGEYLPRPGDIVIKNGYNHYALVVRTEPDTVSDTAELSSVKVVTINGNTAGSNHQGGQIQEKTDPYNYWDFYINPFFKGVQVTAEEDYTVDERLKASLGETPAPAAAGSSSAGVDLSVNQYDTSLEPVPVLPMPAMGEAEKEPVEESKIDPKEIMAKDAAFNELHGTLAKNASAEKAHEPAEKKAAEAQGSAVSPPTERLSQAKAAKVEEMGALPKPKEFNARELKESILKEVDRLIKEKEKEANDTGEKPKIKEQEIREIRDVNNSEIREQRKGSVSPVEEAHKQPPDEAAIASRESQDVIVEQAGPDRHIKNTDKAVAKPMAGERITLEEESGKIDRTMEENEVDEQQLEESGEDKFTGSLQQKRESQSEAARVKEDYRAIENEKLEKDKKSAKNTVDNKVEKIHEARETEFGGVNKAKDSTKSADEAKRKEITDKIENLYSDAEKSVTAKLAALELTVNKEFDEIMARANNNFKESVNNALDDEFTWEWASKNIDRDDYNQRVKKVFLKESEKYRKELSAALDPLTIKIADTLNSIISEIEAAKTAVMKFVSGLDPALADIGAQSAKGIMERFASLEQSVTEKQESLTNGLAKKYADGVMALEEEFKKIMDSRKSWLEKALDAIVDAIKEIVNLLADLKKALERAADYGKRIIKAPVKFFNNLVKGATAGFNSFVKNIGKHLLQGALEWVTGEMSDAGIQLPEKFDFKGILSLILQILGISVNNVKEIAKKVIGAKYVDMLEKGMDLGVKTGDKLLQVFSIVKKDGLAGLWEFIKEQFSDLKEKMLEEAKSFIIVTIVETAVVKIVSMLVPGAGFISAVKSLIDFMRTLFAKARQIVNIITGIIDTFAEILAGNVAKVSSMVENVLAKFLGMAITFLAAILGLGKVGKKINDIIQKKIREPVSKAITKMMEKLKALMTKLGIFKFLDKVDEKIKAGKKWVDDKKEKVKEKATEALSKVKGFLKGMFNKYTDENGETHTLRFKDLELYRESVSKTLGNYLLEVKTEISKLPNADERKKHAKSVSDAFGYHKEIVTLIGETVKLSGGKYQGADAGFSPKDGEKLRVLLQKIANILKELPLKGNRKIIPKTKIAYKDGVADGINAKAVFISLDSDEAGSQPAGANSPLSQKIIDVVLKKKDNHNLVRGHLINHELFGTGVGTKNLAPIPKRANAHMLSKFEKDAKNLVHANHVISLDVSVAYGAPNDKQHGGKSLLQRELKAGTKMPVSVSFTLNQLDFTGRSNAKDADINKVQNWKYNGLSKKEDIPINHDDFF